MIWAVYGMLHGALRAALTETSRFDGDDLRVRALRQSVFSLIFLAPFSFLMKWPGDERFYLAAVGVAVIFSVGTLIQQGMAAQKLGRVSGLYIPLEAVAAFILWLLVSPTALRHYGGDPVMSAGVAVAFTLGAFCLLRIRPQDMGWRIFLVVLPTGLTYAVAGVVTKIVMPVQDIVFYALSFAVINFAVMALIMGVAAFFAKERRFVPDGKTIKATALSGFFQALAYVVFVAGVASAPNPAYISMLAMLLPVWLLIGHRVMRAEDNAKPVPAAGLVVAALVLLFFAR